LAEERLVTHQLAGGSEEAQRSITMIVEVSGAGVLECLG
jgi:hypothetical protein